jgi:hypothetical protein
MAEDTIPARSLPTRRRVFLFLALVLLLVIASLFLAGQKDAETIIVTFPNGKALEAEVADTPEKLLFGLAFRDSLPPDSGMLYIFETTDYHRVRTKGFRIPVDMIWADENRRVLDLVEDAKPCPQDPCPFYGPPPEKARYLIQTAAGYVREKRIAPGMEMTFTLRM